MSDSFRIAHTTSLLSSHVFDVVQHDVEHGDERFTREVAVHPGAVAILVINSDGAVGIIRQYRATVDAYTWEIPAGTQDVEGEPPLTTAQRELKEEMGCTAQRWRLLGRFMNSPGWTNQIMTIYEARDLELGARQPEGPEETSSTIHWMTPTVLRTLLRNEPAIDSTMAVALHRVYGTFFDDV